MTAGGVNLVDKVALITGATGNMGKVFANRFAGAGADLVLSARNPNRLDALARDLEARHGVAVRTVGTDLTVPGAPASLADAAWNALGKIDIILSNAIPPEAATPSGRLTEVSPQILELMQRSIVWGPLEMIGALCPRMAQCGGGAIVTVISTTGLTPTPGFGAYGLAKAGLALMTKYLAREWGDSGIRANAVNPGSIMSNDDDPETYTKHVEALGILKRTSLGRLGRNEEVAEAALFLASDAASYISGQILNIDGGRF